MIVALISAAWRRLTAARVAGRHHFRNAPPLRLARPLQLQVIIIYYEEREAQYNASRFLCERSLVRFPLATSLTPGNSVSESESTCGSDVELLAVFVLARLLSVASGSEACSLAESEGLGRACLRACRA